MIEIDGSYLEGGGQILRTSLSLSAALSLPFKIRNIRLSRPKKGLLSQHLTAVRAVGAICNAEVSGATLNSTEITFMPGKVSHGNYSFDIGTAGSATLVMQAILPALTLANGSSYIQIRGGTHVMKSPSYEYFEHCFLKNVSRLGIRATSQLIRPGFYPQGGGEVSLSVSHSLPKRYDFIERGSLVSEEAYIINANLPQHIIRREQDFLSRSGRMFTFSGTQFDACPSTGNAITIIGEFGGYAIGSDGLGALGKPAEKVAGDCLRTYVSALNSGGVDDNMSDQLLVYFALAGGGALKYGTLTAHTRTNINTIEQFIGKKFVINEEERIISL
ncbi:MAG: RNA 3'-terminal phosphate cyclase [Candidatus Micrarchaeota archaeon]|nr:RNA 3'-terminal phosphate cyclase [Candidatus Micrarchaeota archaeon]